jgi:hypothetical protein
MGVRSPLMHIWCKTGSKFQCWFFCKGLFDGVGVDNLTVVIMEVSQKARGLSLKYVTQKLLCVRVDGVSIFQGTKTRIIKHIHINYAPFYIGVHCLVHRCNLAFKTLSSIATPLWAKCEGESHTPKSGNLESSGTPENSELELKGQNTSNWGVLGVIGKVLKCRCLNWPRIGNLDIYSPSYGQKKGRESNWQFDSRPLKVGNRPLPDVCSESATGRWKALEESYNFGSNLVPIQVRGEKLWTPNVPGVQTGTVSGLHLGSPGKKSHLNVASVQSCKEYYKGEGGGFPRVRAVVCHVSPSYPVACPNTKCMQNDF